MTFENCIRLREHYKKLIDNPDLAFAPHARIKPRGRESIVENAKLHLADIEENIKIREHLKENPSAVLKPDQVLRKLKDPKEAVDKEVISEPKKEKSKNIK